MSSSLKGEWCPPEGHQGERLRDRTPRALSLPGRENPGASREPRLPSAEAIFQEKVWAVHEASQAGRKKMEKQEKPGAIFRFCEYIHFKGDLE